MVGVFEQYTERTKSHSENLRGRYESDTKRFILESFESSPTFRNIDVYERDIHKGEYGVRVNMIERMGNIRNLLLKPGEDLSIGNMARFEERNWLLYDKFGYHESGVKMTAMRLNHTLKWLDNSGKKDDDGLDFVHQKRCYASSSDIGSKSKQSRANIEYNKYDVRLPYGQLYIFIESTEESRQIDLNYRFIINKIPYEVIGVDNTTHVEDDYGIIQYTVKRVPLHDKDDIELGLAFNAFSKEGEVQTQTVKDVKTAFDSKDGEKGGYLW